MNVFEYMIALFSWSCTPVYRVENRLELILYFDNFWTKEGFCRTLDWEERVEYDRSDFLEYLELKLRYIEEEFNNNKND